MSAEHGPSSHEKISLPTIERHERPHSPEKEPEQEALKPQEARKEVSEALEAKKAPGETEAAPTASKTRTQHTVSPAQKKRAFTHIMSDVQKDMSPSSKAFSKFIHTPAVEATSEVIGNTVARPTSILYGSFCAFIVLLGTYLLAKHNGFQLSGFEFIGLFALGWAVGLLADFFRHMITGQK